MNPEIYREMASIEDRHWWFRARRRIIASILQGLRLPKNLQILEAGCGTGGNLTMLGQFGQVTAFEPDRFARETVAMRTDITPLDGSLPDGLQAVSDQQFDLVCAFDILEHIEDDQGAFNALSELVKPGGYIALTVPAFAFLWSAHDQAHQHKRRYLKKQLVEIIANSPMELRHISYFNCLLFIPIAVVRLGRKFLKIDTAEANLKVPGKVLNGLLEGIFAIERFVVRRFSMPFGVSVVVLAQRPK